MSICESRGSRTRVLFAWIRVLEPGACDRVPAGRWATVDHHGHVYDWPDQIAADQYAREVMEDWDQFTQENH